MTSSSFPREDYAGLAPYDPGRAPIEVDLTDNTNLWGPHPAALEVVGSAPPETLTRYPSVYADELKEAVANRFGVGQDQVTTGSGSDGILDAVFRAAAFPPGRMSYPAPSFSMVEVFGRMNGLAVTPLPWDRARESPGALLEGRPDLIYICRPNNPTGASLAREWVLELLEMVEPQGPLVVVDEAYADFSGESLIPEAAASERLLVLRTLSKLYGLAGLRVGFGVGPRSLILEAEKSRGPYRIAHLAEMAAAAALRDDSGWVEKMAERTRESRERLRQELTHRGLSPLPSDANFLLVPVGDADALKVNQGLRAGGVAARPFKALPDIGDALRVTVGPWPLMERFLVALDGWMAGEGGGRP